MVSTKPKLEFLMSWLILLSSVFIFVSVSAEERKCHWCGPLAEQVHRSRRSRSCDEDNIDVTTCDPGYSYCAIVATSPPYIESRHCVKLYQDECYHTFCNTTKTWKMTCPCRGDLCNGHNKERELEAFQTLPKLVAKTHRVKKALILSNNLIKVDNNQMKIEINTTEPYKNAQTNNIDIKLKNKSQIDDNVLNTNIVERSTSTNNMSSTSLDLFNKFNDKNENIMDMQSDQPFNNDKKTKNGSCPEYVEKSVIPLTTGESIVNLDKTATTASTIKSNEMDVHGPPIDKEVLVKADKVVKSSEASTAEARQHNGNSIASTENVSEDTTLTTIMTTDADEDMYKPTNPGKNFSVRISSVSNIILVSYLIVVHSF